MKKMTVVFNYSHGSEVLPFYRCIETELSAKAIKKALGGMMWEEFDMYDGYADQDLTDKEIEGEKRKFLKECCDELIEITFVFEGWMADLTRGMKLA